MSPHPLHALFSPRTVAVVGASSDPERIGGRVLRFLLESGFAGEVHPVNRSGAAQIQGQPAYASVQAIAGALDQAIIVTPAAGVEAAVEECIAKGVQCVLVLTAGFAEAGPEGRAAQQRLAQRCAQAGVRLVGPNSLGLLNVATHYHATFSTALYGLALRPGPIGLATQSGAFGSAAWGMATLRGLGFSRIVATGNEADVDVAECIDYLAEDADTRVICAGLESCRDGERLRRALRKAAVRGKPVIIMKVGRTEQGAAAASTHTGNLAGNDDAFDAVFAECGAWRAQSLQEMLDIAAFCATSPRLPAHADVGLLTVSGGIGVLMADQAGSMGERGLRIPPLNAVAEQAARELLPFAQPANPLDTTAQITALPGGLTRAIELLITHQGFGAVIAYMAHGGLSSQRFATRLQELAALRERHPQQPLVLVMLACEEVQRQLQALGLVVFDDPSRAVLATSAAAWLQRQQAVQAAWVPPPAAGEAKPLGPVDSEHEAKRALAAAGLPMLPEHLCATADEAVQAAAALGWPLVAKIASPDIAHKTEVGGVILNIADEAALRQAHATLLQRARAARPDARLQGVLLAPQWRGGVELLLGVKVDATFGPMVVFGAGGTAVELYRDVALASAPLSQADARALIARVRCSALLRGWRGAAPLDEAALVQALCALSHFAVQHAAELESIDINPFVLREQGGACLDAVIARRHEVSAP